MTIRMTHGVAADVAFLVNLVETHPEPAERTTLLEMAARNLSYQVSFQPGEHITGPAYHKAPHINDVLSATFQRQLGEAHAFSSRIVGNYLDLGVDLKSGTLRLLIPKNRMIAGNADIFILWMVISALVLLAIAIIFLRNQVRPIEQLAHRRRSLRPRPRGARLQAARRHRSAPRRPGLPDHARAHRTLSAAAHRDAGRRQPRPEDAADAAEAAARDDGRRSDAAALREDVADMERMLDEYLDFARGEGGEDGADHRSVGAGARGRRQRPGAARTNAPLGTDIAEGLSLPVKRNALRRCLNNLIDNALKHGSQARW